MHHHRLVLFSCFALLLLFFAHHFTLATTPFASDAPITQLTEMRSVGAFMQTHRGVVVLFHDSSSINQKQQHSAAVAEFERFALDLGDVVRCGAVDAAVAEEELLSANGISKRDLPAAIVIEMTVRGRQENRPRAKLVKKVTQRALEQVVYSHVVLSEKTRVPSVRNADELCALTQSASSRKVLVLFPSDDNDDGVVAAFLKRQEEQTEDDDDDDPRYIRALFTVIAHSAQYRDRLAFAIAERGGGSLLLDEFFNSRDDPVPALVLFSCNDSSSSSSSSLAPTPLRYNGDADREAIHRFLLPEVRPQFFPLRPVVECASMQECISSSAHADEPFVVRSAPEFSKLAGDLEAFLQVVGSREETVTGARPSSETFDVRLGEAVQRWVRAKNTSSSSALDINIFDSPVPALQAAMLPAVLSTDCAPRHPQGADRLLSVLLTYAGAYSCLHIDPPAGGGGWMWLAAGRKRWHFAHPRYTLDFMRESNWSDAAALQVMRERFAAEGGEDEDLGMFSVEARAGDLVMFPPGWLHRVWTEEKAIGLSGYSLCPGTEATLKFALEQQEKLKE